MAERIGGLDPSLRATGICTADGNLITVKTDKMRGAERMLYIRDAALEALGDCDFIAIEGFAFGARGRAVFDIGGIGWVLRTALHERGIRVVEVSPAQLKKYATGHGRASKAQMIKAAQDAGAEPKDDNMADAFHLRAWAMV